MSFRFKLDPSKRIQKIQAKYIVILRLQSSHKSVSRMAILSEDGRIAEYEFIFKSKDSITYATASRIRQIFQPYQITSSTEVIFSSGYGKTEPLYLYFMFLRQQLEFNLRTVQLEVMLRTISEYHNYFYTTKRADIGKAYLNKLWDKLVEKQKCQWITRDLDLHFKSISNLASRERKALRIALYYLVIKNYNQKRLYEYKHKNSE